MEATKQLKLQIPAQRTGGHETYAEKAARPARTYGVTYSRPTQDYLSMSRKKATPRAKATKTNGALVRVYVKDWREEPVGEVKRVLRQAIST